MRFYFCNIRFSDHCLVSYREAAISCAMMGNAKMVLLWAEKSADVVLNSCGRKLYDDQDGKLCSTRCS